METNWFEDGVKAASDYESEMYDFKHSDSSDDLEPSEAECPWPIYTQEGTDWLRGWNSMCLLGPPRDEDGLLMRPFNAGFRFYPSDDQLDLAEAMS